MTLEIGAYIWDNKALHVGVVDRIEGELIHYRVHEVGHERPHGGWTIEQDVTLLTGPLPPDDSTITERMIWDLLECNPTFNVEPESGDVLWADRDGTTYKVEVRLPGLSGEQRVWGGRVKQTP